jgi:2-polyprenyl-3-methyl-5-hydroxy-6-metoxy-1,4-benzoquinol methylase
VFRKLEEIQQRPQPFEFYTADELWTDEHTSKQMLSYHLNPEIDAASRNKAFIEQSVSWIGSRFHLEPGKKVADFGCGPGLYTNRLAEQGASVLGIDFSELSLDYARKIAAEDKLDIQYLNQNYLEFETDERFDLILMIMCDYCALSPDQRKQLLDTFHKLLLPDGRVLLDVYSLSAFSKREEVAAFSVNHGGGFWSPNKYYEFKNAFKYEHEKVFLEKYTVVELNRTRTIYNWLQHFDRDSLQDEFLKSGLEISAFYADAAGRPFDPHADEFAVVAKRTQPGT